MSNGWNRRRPYDMFYQRHELPIVVYIKPGCTCSSSVPWYDLIKLAQNPAGHYPLLLPLAKSCTHQLWYEITDSTRHSIECHNSVYCADIQKWEELHRNKWSHNVRSALEHTGCTRRCVIVPGLSLAVVQTASLEIRESITGPSASNDTF